MKQTKYLFFAMVSVILTIAAVISCTPMDDYLKYTDGKEIIYTGQVDSLHFRSGKGRVVFSGLLISDPNVDKVVAYWNSRKNSIVIENIINKRGDASVFPIDTAIVLPEGSYNFEVITYDAKGNSSVVRNEKGISYGSRYESGLYNRPVQNVKQEDGYVEVTWYNADPTSYVDLQFEDENGVLCNRIITANMDTALLWRCKEASPILVQTCFVPDEHAIDTFKLAKRTINADANYTTRYIKNSGAGGAGIDGTVLGVATIGTDTKAECGYPTDWMVSDEMKVDDFIHGWLNSKTRKERVLNFYSTKDQNIANGKVYQTISLDKTGQYTLSYNCFKGTPPAADWTKADVYFVAAKGNVLPNISDLRAMESAKELNNGVLSFYHIEKSIPVKGDKGHDVTFRIEEGNTDVTFGFVMDLNGDKSTFQVSEVKLIYDAVF